jgi:hypothetical protein
VGPRGGLDAVAGRKKSLSLPGIEPGRPAHSLVTILTQIPGLAVGPHISSVILRFIFQDNIT